MCPLHIARPTLVAPPAHGYAFGKTGSGLVIRYRLRRRDFDQLGALTQEALRAIAHALWDAPAGVRVIVDLGSCRHLQHLLIRDLALYQCAHSVQFAGPDWQMVRDHSMAMADAVRRVA
jgi:hypothetical protein